MPDAAGSPEPLEDSTPRDRVLLPQHGELEGEQLLLYRDLRLGDDRRDAVCRR